MVKGNSPRKDRRKKKEEEEEEEEYEYESKTPFPVPTILVTGASSMTMQPPTPPPPQTTRRIRSPTQRWPPEWLATPRRRVGAARAAPRGAGLRAAGCGLRAASGKLRRRQTNRFRTTLQISSSDSEDSLNSFSAFDNNNNAQRGILSAASYRSQASRLSPGGAAFSRNQASPSKLSTSLRTGGSRGSRLSAKPSEVEKLITPEVIAAVYARWSAAHRRVLEKQRLKRPIVDYVEWRKRRREDGIIDPPNGVCLRNLKYEFHDTDLRSITTKYQRLIIAEDFAFKFPELKNYPPARLAQFRHNDAGVFHFDAAKISPIFGGQRFCRRLRFDEDKRIEFGAEKRNPATKHFMFEEEGMAENEEEPKILDPKTCSLDELKEEILLPLVLKHVGELLYLLRHEEFFSRKRGKVNPCDFLAFRLFMHNPRHRDRMKVRPLPKCIADVHFFDSIPIVDRSCCSRRPTTEQLLEEILASGMMADPATKKTTTMSPIMMPKPVEGDSQIGSGFDLASDPDVDPDVEPEPRNSFLERRRSETFWNLAGKYDDGVVYFYQDRLCRQIKKEDEYRAGHKWTRRNRFYRLEWRLLSAEEAAVIIQAAWRGYRVRKTELIRNVRRWQKEWRLINDLFRTRLAERRRLFPTPPPTPPPEPYVYCKGDELICRCGVEPDTGEDLSPSVSPSNEKPKVEAPELTIEATPPPPPPSCSLHPPPPPPPLPPLSSRCGACRCDPTKSVFKKPPPVEPDKFAEREVTIELGSEDNPTKLCYIERGRWSPFKPSLLFLHALTLQKSVWRDVMEELSAEGKLMGKDQHMMALDLPGHGNSTLDISECSVSHTTSHATAHKVVHFANAAQRPRAAHKAPTPPTPEDLVDRLLRILTDFVSATSLSAKPFHLVGHAIGGSLAILFAAKFPEKLTQLTLMAPLMTTYPRASALFRGIRFSLPSRPLPAHCPQPHRFDHPSIRSDHPPFHSDLPPLRSDHLVLRSFLFPVTLEDMEVVLNQTVHDLDVADAISGRKMETELNKRWMMRKTYFAIFEALMRRINDVNRILPSISTPTLILWGLNDHFVDVCGARILERQIPATTRVRILMSSGHGIEIEAATEVALQIARVHNNEGFLEGEKSRVFF